MFDFSNRMPVIFGCKSTSLSQAEKEFFAQTKPVGFILFARNIESKPQVKNLIAEFKQASENPDALILIDQEGGRVARLKAPVWPEFPAAGALKTIDAVYENYEQIAHMLAQVDINVNCAPMLDVPSADSHDIIGDRAFSDDPQEVAQLGQACSDAMLKHGVYSVIKHIPGHGRARVDSHEDLPVVEASLDELRSIDFEPFKQLKDLPFAMTAHILYKAIDPENVATLSAKTIQIIREEIGFKNILMTDDMSMKALTGDIGENSLKALKAGCDLVLHCNGEMDEMQKISSAIANF